MSHQDGFGNNRTEPIGSTKPDDDDYGVQKKSENVAHAEDGIRLKKLKNSGNLRRLGETGSSKAGGMPLSQDENIHGEKLFGPQVR